MSNLHEKSRPDYSDEHLGINFRQGIYGDWSYDVCITNIGFDSWEDANEEAEMIKNEIYTNHILVEHILDCPICIKTGIGGCPELSKLKGVYS